MNHNINPTFSATSPEARLESTPPPVQSKVSPYLLSRSSDLLMSGGASLILFVLCMIFADRGLQPFQYIGVFPNGQTIATPLLSQMSWIFFLLSFIVNFPHFLISYQLLYWDCRKDFLRTRRYIWAGVVVPLILLGSMVYVPIARPESIPIFIYAMFALVGWHYAKQVYGIFILTSARRGIYYGSWEKMTLRLSLLTLGALGWIGSNSTSQILNFNGFNYSTLNIPSWVMVSAQVLFFVLASLFFGLLVRKYVEEGSIPPTVSILACVSMMVWYLPVFSHPLFFFSIPFFHSLQYLWFAIAFRKNKVMDGLIGNTGVQYRSGILRSLWGYILLAVILGAVTFNVLPDLLDRSFPFGGGPYPPLLFAALAAIFLNIHHFFIDNVIWKKENKEVGKYLVRR